MSPARPASFHSSTLLRRLSTRMSIVSAQQWNFTQCSETYQKLRSGKLCSLDCKHYYQRSSLDLCNSIRYSTSQSNIQKLHCALKGVHKSSMELDDPNITRRHIPFGTVSRQCVYYRQFQVEIDICCVTNCLIVLQCQSARAAYIQFNDFLD